MVPSPSPRAVVRCPVRCLLPRHLQRDEDPQRVPVHRVQDHRRQDEKSIVVEEKGAKGASFADFTSKLPDGDCRYAVLDVEINTKSGATTNKLIFVAWYAPGAQSI